MFLTVVRWLQPRDYTSAARVMSVLAMVAGAVTIVFAAVSPANVDLGSIALTVALGTLVALAGWRAFYAHDIHPNSWAAAPFLAVGLIVTLDFVTKDGTVTGQIFFFFPTLYGASQLRRPGALIAIGLSVIGEVAVVVSLLPIRQAIVEIGYVTAAMVTTAGLLMMAGQHQDALVEKLHQAAAIDSLTGLVTRRVLDQAAQSAISVAASTEGTALMVVDVDDFKLINDRYGHPAGDEVLIQLAALLVNACRPTDVASRMGGDELALLLLGCSKFAMTRRAEGMLAQIRAHPFCLNDQHTINVTVSAGLAHTSTQARTFHALYAAADEALYRAKRLGRNRVEEASDTFDATTTS
jgi:diguanylate cyclase (GGDEF)-like protein